MGSLGPGIRIIIFLLAAMGLVTVFANVTSETPPDLKLVPIAATQGPFKVLFAPAIIFDLGFKIVYAFFLFLAVGLTYNGIKYRDSNLGQFAAVAGIIIWVLCGWIGLETGEPRILS